MVGDEPFSGATAISQCIDVRTALVDWPEIEGKKYALLSGYIKMLDDGNIQSGYDGNIRVDYYAGPSSCVNNQNGFWTDSVYEGEGWRKAVHTHELPSSAQFIQVRFSVDTDFNFGEGPFIPIGYFDDIHFGPPTLPVSAIVNGNDINMTWEHLDSYYFYGVFRSTDPYFTPDESTLLTIPLLEAPTANYSDVGVMLSSSNSFYAVRGDMNPFTVILSQPSIWAVESQRIGKFSYPLVAGS